MKALKVRMHVAPTLYSHFLKMLQPVEGDFEDVKHLKGKLSIEKSLNSLGEFDHAPLFESIQEISHMHLHALLPTPLSLAACHPMPVLRTREGRMVRTVERVVPAVRRASEVKVVIQANGLTLTRFRKRFKRSLPNPLIIRALFRSGEIFIRSVVSFVKAIVEMVRSAVGVSMSSTGTISDRVYGVEMQKMF